MKTHVSLNLLGLLILLLSPIYVISLSKVQSLEAPLYSQSTNSQFYSAPITLTPVITTIHPFEIKELTLTPRIQLLNQSILATTLTLNAINQTQGLFLDITIFINAHNVNQYSLVLQTNQSVLLNGLIPVSELNQSSATITLRLQVNATTLPVDVDVKGVIYFIFPPTHITGIITSPLKIPVYPVAFTYVKHTLQDIFIILPSTITPQPLNLTIHGTQQSFNVTYPPQQTYNTSSYAITRILIPHASPNQLLLFYYSSSLPSSTPITLTAILEPLSTQSKSRFDTTFITIALASLFFIIPLILRHYSYLHELKKVKT